MSLNVLIPAALAYVVFLFVIASLAERRAERLRAAGSAPRFLRSPLVYTLSLSVYATAWTFYGAVGYATRSGLEYLTIYLGPTLIFVGWWGLLRKLVRIGKAQRVTSIADLISARYGKSNLIGVIVTLLAVAATTPYIALQLQSIALSFGAIAQDQSLAPRQLAIWVAAGLALFTILFGTRNLDANERQGAGLDQPGIGRNDADAPAPETIRQALTQGAIEREQQLALANAGAPGRVDDDQAGGAVWPGQFTDRATLERAEFGDAGALGVLAGHADHALIAVKAQKTRGNLRGGLGRGLDFHGVKGGRVIACQLLEREGPAAPGQEPRRDFSGLDRKRARSAHRIQHGLRAIIAQLPQEQRGQRFTHRRLADGSLVAAPVQGLATAVQADGAQIIVDPHLQDQRGVIADRRAQRFADRGFQPLSGGLVVIDTGFVANGLDFHGDIGAQKIGPGHLSRPFVQLRQMHRPECGDAHQNAGRTAQRQIGAPDLGPAAAQRDPAGPRLRARKALRRGLGRDQRLGPRGADQKDFEIIAHATALPCRRCLFQGFSKSLESGWEPLFAVAPGGTHCALPGRLYSAAAEKSGAGRDGGRKWR